MLDGANQLADLRQVVLPLSRPALATLAVLSFLSNWNDFLWPIFVLFSPESLTLPPGLAAAGRRTSDYPVIMAGAVRGQHAGADPLRVCPAAHHPGRVAQRAQGLTSRPPVAGAQCCWARRRSARGSHRRPGPAGAATGHSPPRPSTEEAAIFDLSAARTVARFRPFELVAPGFAVTARRRATRRSACAPFAAVEVRRGAGHRVSASAGLVADGRRPRAGALVAGRSSQVRLSVRRDGRTRVLRRRGGATDGSSAGARLRAVREPGHRAGRHGRRLAAGADRARPRSPRLVDLRRPRTLGAARLRLGARDGRCRGPRRAVRDDRAARPAPRAARRRHVRTTRDGRVYLTWTCAGLGFFQQAHWTVWSMRPRRRRPTCGWRRSCSRAATGWCSGTTPGRWSADGRPVARWPTSSWGDFDAGLASTCATPTTTDDVLQRGARARHRADAAADRRTAAWDPACTRIDGTWHVGVRREPLPGPVRLPPGSGRAPAARDLDRGPRRRSAAADDAAPVRGPDPRDAWAGRRGCWPATADARSYPVFDLAGRRVGRLDAPYPTNIPHPQLVPTTRTVAGWMVTFDGTPVRRAT